MAFVLTQGSISITTYEGGPPLGLFIIQNLHADLVFRFHLQVQHMQLARYDGTVSDVPASLGHLKLQFQRRITQCNLKADPCRGLTVKTRLLDLQVRIPCDAPPSAILTDMYRARRVKCDELKPLCQRCLKAGRLCGGYEQMRKTVHSSSSAALSASPMRPALKAGVQSDRSTERLCHLAAHVLSLDHDGFPSTTAGVWGRLFLQLSNQVECVKAAAAAFGAAYELWFNNDSLERSSSALRHYGSALTQLRSAFTETTDLEPIALASMVLACAEIMSQREENALNHFLGAVQIVYKSSAEGDDKEPSAEIATIKDELVKVDILIGSYGLAQTPQIARFEDYGGNEPSDHVFREPHIASNAALHCLYRSRQFIDAASKVRYVYPGWKDRDSAMCDAQSEMAGQCQIILDGLAGLVERLQAEHAEGKASSKDDGVLADIYGLRTQITTTLIFVLCIHDPFQAVYDEHLALFQSIISDAAASSRLRRRAKTSTLKRFSTRPGIISPLFFVSMKCRDPSVRSLATTMLREQGREGPSDGHIMAAIGARVAALESPNPGQCGGSPDKASGVPEDLRIHGHGVEPEKATPDGRPLNARVWRTDRSL